MATLGADQTDSMARMINDMDKADIKTELVDAYAIGTLRHHVYTLIQSHSKHCRGIACPVCLTVDEMAGVIMAVQARHGDRVGL